VARACDHYFAVGCNHLWTMTNPSDEKLSLPLVNAAVFSSSYKTIAPSVQSIGLRTNGLRYRSLTFTREQRTAEEFLLNTRVHRHDREMARSVENYFVDQSVAMLSLLGQESTAGRRTIKLSPAYRSASLLAQRSPSVAVAAAIREIRSTSTS